MVPEAREAQRVGALRRRFWAGEHWCQNATGKVEHPFEGVALLCSLLMLPTVLIQDSKLRTPWGEVADGLGAFVWLVFAGELVLTLRHADDRRTALRAHWHDVVVVLVILPAWAPLFAAFGGAWLRGWRLARLWAIAARVVRAERLLTRRHGLPYAAALTGLVVTVAGIAVHETDGNRFPNVWRGLWFALVTVTTVGYGDTFPTSTLGRVAASLLAVVGIGFLGLATGAIGAHFVNADAQEHRRAARNRDDEILAQLQRLNDRLDKLERS